MSKCPYNASVECNKEFQQNELTRQLNLALRSGMYWFNTTPQGVTCAVKHWQCARLLAANQVQR